MKGLGVLSVITALLVAAYSARSIIPARLMRELKSTGVMVSLCRAISPYHTPLPVPAHSGGVVFFGDSLTAFGPWEKLLPDVQPLIHGVSGDSTVAALCRVGQLAATESKKIFIMIGINDLLGGFDATTTLRGFDALVQAIRTEAPNAQLYVLSLLPLNHEIYRGVVTPEAIVSVNAGIKQRSQPLGYHFIDLYPLFLDGADRQLRRDLTKDGIHITPDAYGIWVAAIRPHLASP